MKKFLLPETGNFYKANLHCHSTFSDGDLTPEQIKEAYMARGYSIVAYTDHDILISHSYLNDKNFLALNGLELYINSDRQPWVKKDTVHICMIALDPDNLNQPCYHRTKVYPWGNALKYIDKIKFDPNKPDFVREYTSECINKMIKEGRDSGFFVTYNHPAWSMENFSKYSQYKGMNAIEICNGSSTALGFLDYVPHVYDDLLLLGNKLHCIGADDNHNHNPLNSRYTDSFCAFTMIKADKLDYRTITDALVKGNFYASQGPEIYELYREDDYVHIKCSPADSIQMNTGCRHAVIYYDEDGNGLTEASFLVDTPVVDYIRFTVTDKQGRHANTNAYYKEDLFNL